MTIDSVRGWAERAIDWLAIAAFAGIFVCVFLQVILRYAFNSPMTWSEELARYLLIWCAFLGWIIASRHDSHLAMTFVVDRFPARIRTMLEVAIQLATLFFAWILGTRGWKLTTNSWDIENVAVPFNLGVVYLIEPIAALAIAAYAMANLLAAIHAFRRGTVGRIRTMTTLMLVILVGWFVGLFVGIPIWLAMAIGRVDIPVLRGHPGPGRCTAHCQGGRFVSPAGGAAVHPDGQHHELVEHHEPHLRFCEGMRWLDARRPVPRQHRRQRVLRWNLRIGGGGRGRPRNDRNQGDGGRGVFARHRGSRHRLVRHDRADHSAIAADDHLRRIGRSLHRCAVHWRCDSGLADGGCTDGDGAGDCGRARPAAASLSRRSAICGAHSKARSGH